MSLKRRFATLMGWEAPLTNIVAGNKARGFSLKSLDGKEYSQPLRVESDPTLPATISAEEEEPDNPKSEGDDKDD